MARKNRRLEVVEEATRTARIIRQLNAELGVRAASAVLVESTAWMDSPELAEILQGRIDGAWWLAR